jgi:hypothetical protein
VAVEDGARQARPRHDITDGQGCERPVEQQFPGRVEDPSPGVVGRNAWRPLRHRVAEYAILLRHYVAI